MYMDINIIRTLMMGHSLSSLMMYQILLYIDSMHVFNSFVNIKVKKEID